MEYQKINTLFKRDENNIIIPTEFTLPEFDYLRKNIFECTEKIDGCNLRMEIKGKEITFAGRTNKAQIPPHLLEYLKNTFTPEIVFNALGVSPETGINEASTCTIYGEGYGFKIQKGSNYIKNGVGFILFDVRIDRWWLKREDCERIAEKLGCPIVPIIGYMTLTDAVKYVKGGFKSTIAENKDYDAEGLVLKTPDGLLLRNGERLITKIKTVDFIKFKNKYGEEALEQQLNSVLYHG